MNDLQKEQIRHLRIEGQSYLKIAQILGISQNTIKSFCRRNNLGGYRGEQTSKGSIEQVFCKECGKPLINKESSKPRKFCCDRCRMLWWQNHPELLNKKAIYYFTCASCGTVFSSYGNQKRKYCSHPCYIKGRFGSKKERVIGLD